MLARRFLLVGCWLATFWLCSVRLPARADAYQDVIDDAIHEFEQRNFVEARALFEQAHAMRPSARTLRALGFCAYELRHYAQAQRELQAALDDVRNPLTEAQVSEVRNALQKVKRYVGQLQLATQPPSASIVLDGRSVRERTFELDAGDHQLVGSAPGYQTRELKVTVAGGQLATANLVLPPLELAPSDAVKAETKAQDAAAPLAPTASLAADDRTPALTERWWFWTAIGVAVAGATVATVLIATHPSNKPEQTTTGVTLHTL